MDQNAIRHRILLVERLPIKILKSVMFLLKCSLTDRFSVPKSDFDRGWRTFLYPENRNQPKTIELTAVVRRA